MIKAPTKEHIIQLRYDYLKAHHPARIQHFEEALNIRISTGGRSFNVSCTSDEDFDFYEELITLLGYPPLQTYSWDRRKGLLKIQWR